MIAWENRIEQQFPNGHGFLDKLAAILEMPTPDFIQTYMMTRGWEENEIEKTVGEFLDAWLSSLAEHLKKNGDLLPAAISNGVVCNESNVFSSINAFVNTLKTAQNKVKEEKPIVLSNARTNKLINLHRQELSLIKDMVEEVDYYPAMAGDEPLDDDSFRDRATAAAALVRPQKNFNNQLAEFLLQQLETALSSTRPLRIFPN